jgi:hypothetical protein
VNGNDTAARYTPDALRECSESGVSEELQSYLDNPYASVQVEDEPGFPLPDEPHIEAWTSYVEEAERRTAFESLRERFVQLRFPIQEGMSDSEEYRAATRRGRFEASEAFAPGVELTSPDGVSIAIHETVAGRVPVIVAAEREDFETLVRAFASRNEPEPVPSSMGACIVTGFNNWDRVHRYRRRWESQRDQSKHKDTRTWDEVFRAEVVPNKSRYQDRFIILSTGNYSGCDAGSLELSEEQWRETSLSIRREHEFTHYFTHRVFGRMANHLLDEIVADFVGLVKVMGRYDVSLARRFLGIEDYPSYRDGGRLENYLGEPPVGERSKKVLECLSHRATGYLARFSSHYTARLPSLSVLGASIVVLMRLGLDGLGADDAPATIERELEELLSPQKR